MKIPTDKIREVIGTGGKVIREIVEKTGAKIDINDDGQSRGCEPLRDLSGVFAPAAGYVAWHILPHGPGTWMIRRAFFDGLPAASG
jgi:hypothetical protein